MKNTFLFIFLLFSISAFSQQNKWDIGIIGGPGMTSIRKNYDYKSNPNIAFYTGLSAQYNFNKHFAIHTELAFDRKGTKADITFTDVNGDVTGTGKVINQFNYLTLPILFRASVGNKVKYFLQAGPSLSYLFNATIKYSSTIDDPRYNLKINRTSNTTRMDVGMSVGLGAQIPVNEKFAISCELRGNYGFVDLYNRNSSNVNELNESVNFLVGLNYKLGK
jgi:opacity protein-like surface antigen